MLSSLQSGLSGLQAYQRYLDVIGNNLANANTPGYKSSRVIFKDLFSNMIRNATKPAAGIGGLNPAQIGTGVRVGSIDMKMSQAPVLSTGRPFDLGLQGDGFFILSDGQQNAYTRVGTFGIDGEDFLVDLSTGMRVQTSTLTDIQIEADATIPPTETSEIELNGSLPALIQGPWQEVVTSNATLQEGTVAQITGTNTGPFSLTDGDSMTLRVNGGAAQEITFLAADFTAIGSDITNATAGDVATVINNLGFTGFTASDNGGALVLTTDNTGESATLDLDNQVGAPANTLGLTLSMVSGTETRADENSLLNVLVANKGDYVDGDVIRISGTDADGLVVHTEFIYGAANDGTTLGELRDMISSSFTGATATIDENGNLLLTADEAGEANLSLFINDDENATGSTLWTNFTTTTEGTNEDTASTSVSIYDAMGLSHTLVLTFTRASPLSWEFTTELQSDKDVTMTNNISSIQFNVDGSFNAALGSGNTIEIYFADTNATQTIALDFGSQSGFDGLTQLGDQSTVQISHQDGFSAGQLATMSVEPDGQILGHYTNGQFEVLGQIGVATFKNSAGLTKRGDSLYGISPNSGSPILSTPEAGGAGTIIAGALEQSNVDISEEFLSLIEAQRGFQANARVISTSDEVLLETVNLVR